MADALGSARDLLFEIGTEELPSWYVDEGADALAILVKERLSAAGFAPASVVAYGTPRRLAALASGVPERSARSSEARRGPSAAVAFDADGAPTRAAIAFATANGVDPAALEVRETERGAYVYAVVEVGGEAAADVLGSLLAGMVADLPAPRKMRWADEPTAFVRPVAWLLARFGEEALRFSAAGVEAGAVSYGHRFLAPGSVTVASPADYLPALMAAKVNADRSARRRQVAEAVADLAATAELTPLQDDTLLSEVANLIEWPFPVLGSFEESYLELPEEVLSTVMIKHQRYFPTRAASGRLARHFVAVANNAVTEESVVRDNYERVLAGRLYDAGFFWRSDRSKSLSQHAWALSGIAFQRDLGTMADKIARVGLGAASLADALELGENDREVLERALPLFRADLASEMVFEFPELEGTMARAYALAEGLPAGVADALRDGVLPRGQGGELPLTPAGAAIAVADRLDKLVGFFAIGKRPSGSADPFALRRDALAVARITTARGWTAPLALIVEAAAGAFQGAEVTVSSETQAEVVEFLWDRIQALLVDHGYSVPVVRAAVHGSATPLGAGRRAVLLAELVERAEFADLMALYKRAANLASKAPAFLDAPVRGLFTEPQEAPLLDALPAAQDGVERLLDLVSDALPAFDIEDMPRPALGGLEEPLAAILALKAPLDAFLDGVLVMAEEKALRDNRLALLKAVVDALKRLGALEQLGG